MIASLPASLSAPLPSVLASSANKCRMILRVISSTSIVPFIQRSVSHEPTHRLGANHDVDFHAQDIGHPQQRFWN